MVFTCWVKPLKRQSLGDTHALGITAQKSISLTDDFGETAYALDAYARRGETNSRFGRWNLFALCMRSLRRDR